MNRRFLLLAGLLVIIGGSAVFFARWFLQSDLKTTVTESDILKARKRLGFGPAQPEAAPIVLVPMSSKVRLAIGSVGLPDDAENSQLGDLLTAELSGAKGLELVDRQSLDKVLRELQLSLSGLVRAKDAVRAGKLLRADWFLLGSSAPVNGVSSIVVRVVDARTGIMRDGIVLAGAAQSTRLAAELSKFVRQCREAAAEPKPRVYLAIGTFNDLSVNNRQASLPGQLRAYLTAAYQGKNVTLLEREQVSTLAREVQLDLAGLTDESATNSPVPMQSAYWLVDGYYQSYETSMMQVELSLNIQRMFGRHKQVVMRELPGEPLFRKVKATIDARMADKAAVAVPTRSSEIQGQMAAGRELAQFLSGPMGLAWVNSYQPQSEDQAARQQRNVEEAIRAFQTVLLLDPGHREAKLCLAACLRHPTIFRLDEARDYYRQVIEAREQDNWTLLAGQALEASFMFRTAGERMKWFEGAARQGTNTPAAAFYRQMLQKAQGDVLIRQGPGPKAQELAETRLFEAVRNWNREVKQGIHLIDFDNTGLGPYVASFKTNRAEAAKRLVELLPKLQEANPELAPHLLAGVVSFQVDTNAPILAQFEQSLTDYVEHPEKAVTPDYYFQLLSGPVYYWCRDRRLYGLAAKLIECRARVAGKGRAPTLDNERKMALAYARIGAEKWQQALDVFVTWSNRPVLMGNNGLWGGAFTPVFTTKAANICRKKLDLPEEPRPREFTLGKPFTHLASGSVFLADTDAFWLATPTDLLRVDFEWHTNKSYALPLEQPVSINSVVATATDVWLGTAGAGLLRFDRTTGRWTRLDEASGLLMNFVTAVAPAGDSVWLGYGGDRDGGLGRLDLSSQKASSFTRSLFAAQEGVARVGNGPKSGAPPRGRLGQIAVAPSGDIWFTEGRELRRFLSGNNEWLDAAEAAGCTGFVLAGDRLFAGRYLYTSVEDNNTGLLGLSVLDLKESKWKQLPATDGLPHDMVTAVASNGQDVWFGGMGFVAVVETATLQVRKYAYLNERAVDRIQVAGGFVWAQRDHHLYRAALSNTR